MVIKAIIFDCFGVLVSSARNILSQDFPQYKTEIDDIAHQSDYGLISRSEFNDSLSHTFGMPLEKVKSLYEGHSICDEKTIAWVHDLKLAGKFKIGMLSNVGPGFFELFFNAAKQKELFDTVVLSGDVGIAKPEEAIFELVAERLGVKPSECVMIDDTALNIEAAMNVGMQAIRFISLDQAQHDLELLLESDRA